MPDPSLAGTAAEIRIALAADADDDVLLRIVIQSSDDFHRLDGEAARESFLGQAASTGDPRFDALLAGLAVHLAQQAGLRATPAWTREPERVVEPMWWFGLEDGSGLQAYTYQRTPACLKARGVMFNIDNLASV